MITISSEYGIEISKVRGVVDNSNRILEVMTPFITLFNQFMIVLWSFFLWGGCSNSLFFNLPFLLLGEKFLGIKVASCCCLS